MRHQPCPVLCWAGFHLSWAGLSNVSAAQGDCLHMNVSRYSKKPFPSYRFIPGLRPHPTRDPQGHSYDLEEEILESFNLDNWRVCKPYLYGVDLFNHHYWWEAHEAWEVVWKCVGRHTETGLFLQGLIQVAVAMLKTEQDFRNAAERLARDGTTKLSLVKGTYLGVDVLALSAEVHAYVSGKKSSTPLIRLILSG